MGTQQPGPDPGDRAVAAGETVAARLLLAAADAGARTVFGLPGVHNLAFWAADGPGLPRLVTVRHEQTAGYAADGWARATGGLGLALTTTGPGAANAVAAFGEAAASGSPVLLVASEVATRHLDDGPRVLHKSADQAGMFRALAKGVFTPRTVGDVVRAVPEAIATALAHPRGPVYLDIPTDLLTVPLGRDHPAAHPPNCHSSGGGRAAQIPETVTPDGGIAAALRTATRPLVWAGGGVVAAGADIELAHLAERLHAPVVSTWAGRGLLAGHPLLVDAPPHEPEVAELIASADLLLVVGSAFEGMATRNGAAPLPPVVTVINADPAHLTPATDPDLAVTADAGVALAALLAADLGDHRSWADDPAGIRTAIRARLADDSRTTEAVTFLDAIGGALTPDTVVVCDMAVAGYWAGGYLPARRPRTMQYPVGWGTLGYALPAAVGAAATGAPTLAVCGDGGLMFGLGELATLAQEQLPATVLVIDDGGYGMLRFDQDRAGEPHRGVDLHTPDLTALASAFGIPGSAVDGVGDELRDALATALAARAPRLVTVRAALYPPKTTSPRWAD